MNAYTVEPLYDGMSAQEDKPHIENAHSLVQLDPNALEIESANDTPDTMPILESAANDSDGSEFHASERTASSAARAYTIDAPFKAILPQGLSALFSTESAPFSHYSQDVGSANEENFVQQGQFEDFSTYENDPWIQSVLSQALNHIHSGNHAAGMRLLYKQIEKTASTESPEEAQGLLDYFRHELKERNYDDLASVLDAVYGDEDAKISFDDELTRSSNMADTALYAEIIPDAPHGITEDIVESQFRKDNRDIIEMELNRQRRELDAPAPSFMGMG